jgi:hypothetical protein
VLHLVAKMKRIWHIILAALSLVFVAELALIDAETIEANLYRAAASYRRPLIANDLAEERATRTRDVRFSTRRLTRDSPFGLTSSILPA